jgi:gliding motility-associated-like protein
VDQTIHVEGFISTPTSCLPEGTVSALGFPYGAHLQNPNNPTSYELTFNWSYQNDPSMTFGNASALTNLSAGWYYLILTDEIVHCSIKDSVLVEAENMPVAIIGADPTEGCNEVTPTFTNNSQNSTNYFWDFGNGETAETTDLNASYSYTYYETTTIMLVASMGVESCNDTAYAAVSIVVCGCTDPVALNYNPNAILDDGSCVYAAPTAYVPNVITLNSDNVNELFFIQTENAASIEIAIFDRWGNVIYSGIGDQTKPPVWNGKDKSGQEVDQGVYFYTYKVFGQLAEIIEGQGFVTVVK